MIEISNIMPRNKYNKLVHDFFTESTIQRNYRTHNYLKEISMFINYKTNYFKVKILPN